MMNVDKPIHGIVFITSALDNSSPSLVEPLQYAVSESGDQLVKARGRIGDALMKCTSFIIEFKVGKVDIEVGVINVQEIDNNELKEHLDELERNQDESLTVRLTRIRQLRDLLENLYPILNKLPICGVIDLKSKVVSINVTGTFEAKVI